MATVEKFEELIAWQKARQYAQEIFELTCLEKFDRDFSLVGQIRKSSGSVMDNIAEACLPAGRVLTGVAIRSLFNSCILLKRLYLKQNLNYIVRLIEIISINDVL
ncbi:MAG TPA: four helix bundle protein, partial [Bacteroidales bacterium]|nr:four helix bundle protein [Bacteroidales bacterium]